MSLRWSISPRSEGGAVRLSGNITERADFPAIAARIAGARALCVDLADIEMINSSGVRAWVHFLRDLSGVGCAVELVRCSPVVTHQLSTILTFRGAATVRSVMLPYACAHCGHEHAVEFPPPDAADAAAPPATARCPVCGADAELDDLPERYTRAMSANLPAGARS